MNGTTEVAGKNDMFRVNSFRIIGVGSTKKAVGGISLKEVAPSAVVYSYITALFTRARNSVYTVPLGKTLYVNMWNVGWSTPNDTKFQTARFYTKANVEPSTMFNTGSLFYPYTETIISNAQELITFPIPTKLPAKTDLKVTSLAFTAGAGAGVTALRGFLVTN